MYRYKDIFINKDKSEKIEAKILNNINKSKYRSINNLKEVDYFLENISYIQKGKKDVLEILSYTKYKLKEYLVCYQYGIESFSYNYNSIGIIYSILSLLNLKLYEQAELIFIENKEKIIEIINSNKSNIDDIIDILIYFKISINYIDDISNRLDKLNDKRKKYIYLLINLMEDRKKNILKKIYNNDINLYKPSLVDYKGDIEDIINIFRELNLHQLEQLYLMKLNNDYKDIDVYNMIPCDNLEEYICKVLLDSISLQNNKINYIPDTISKYNYEDDFIKIISYQKNELVSMHILKINELYIIIDCGASMLKQELIKIDIDNFFKENKIDVKKIKCAIISHAHLDHYGSVDLLQNYVDDIYMTKDTYNIINLVSKENILNPNKVKIKKDNQKFLIEDNICIEFFPSNHIKGSIGMCIEYKNKKIIYTGDFSFNRHATTQYIDENYFIKYKNSDYLIIESTNGNKEIDLPYIYKRKLLNYFINLSIRNNIKVIIPAFAIGVAQECYDIINKSTVKANVLVDGLAIKINQYYNKVKNRFNINKKLTYNKNKLINKYYHNNIIIPTGGVINDESIFQNYYKLAIQDSNMVTILKCGHIDKSIIQNKIKPHDTININFIDISLSSHAQYNELIKTINTIKPKNLITVHGNGIKFYNDEIKNTH